MQAHKRDRGALQRSLAKSHGTCQLLRTRVEELLGFLQDLLVVTPPQGGGATEHRTRLLTRLNETRSLLADVTTDLLTTAQFNGGLYTTVLVQQLPHSVHLTSHVMIHEQT